MSRKYSRLCVGRGTFCFPVHSRTLGSNSKPKPTSRKIRVKNGVADEIGNKIMVVVDSSLKAKGALEWALSHTVQTQDTIVLLHVAQPCKQGDSNGKKHNLRAFELLHSMKNDCQRRRPGVEVEVALLEGKERGPVIVEEAKRQRVSLLVLGQERKMSIWWKLIKRCWTSRRRRRTSGGGEVVDYCIQKAGCMTIAVRRKSRKIGGYLITIHHQASQEFLASSLSYFEITLLMDVSAMLVKQWMSMKALDFAVRAASDFSLLSWSIA